MRSAYPEVLRSRLRKYKHIHKIDIEKSFEELMGEDSLSYSDGVNIFFYNRKSGETLSYNKKSKQLAYHNNFLDRRSSLWITPLLFQLPLLIAAILFLFFDGWAHAVCATIMLVWLSLFISLFRKQTIVITPKNIVHARGFIPFALAKIIPLTDTSIMVATSMQMIADNTSTQYDLLMDHGGKGQYTIALRDSDSERVFQIAFIIGCITGCSYLGNNVKASRVPGYAGLVVVKGFVVITFTLMLILSLIMGF